MIGQKRWAAALAVLATVTTATGCGAGGLAIGTAKSCDMGFMPVRLHPTGPRVIAVAWANCVKPPQTHEFTVTLQVKPREQRGGTWQTADQQTSTEIPPPPRQRLVVELGAPCQPGRWRGIAHATGTLDGTPFQFSTTSVERIVSEQDCQKRG